MCDRANSSRGWIEVKAVSGLCAKVAIPGDVKMKVVVHMLHKSRPPGLSGYILVYLVRPSSCTDLPAHPRQV